MKVVAYVPDLMDRSKVDAAGDVTFVRRADELAGIHADLVIADLSRPGVLDVLGSIIAPRVVGFASHVDRALLDAARTAGCTEVLARSAFFSRVADIVSGAD